MTLTYKLHGNIVDRSAFNIVKLLNALSPGDKVETIKLYEEIKNINLFKTISFSKKPYFKNLNTIEFQDKSLISLKEFKLLCFCHALKNIDIYIKNDFCNESFISIFYFMKNKQAKNVNVMFSSYSFQIYNMKIYYLLFLTALNVDNIFLTQTPSNSNKNIFHLFLTALDIMNRKSDQLRGCFLGSSNLMFRKSTKFQEYVKIYPLAKYTKYPSSSYFRRPFPNGNIIKSLF